MSQFTRNFISRLNADFKLRPNRDRSNRDLSNDALCGNSIGILQLSDNNYGESELIKYNKLFKRLFGSTSELLNSKQLNELFSPWINCENIRLGSFHSRDDLALTNINFDHLNDVLNSKAKQMGVQYVKGDIKEMNVDNKYGEDDYGVSTLRKHCNEIIIDRSLNPNLFELTKLQFKKLIIATDANQSKFLSGLLGLDKNNQWPLENR